MQIYAEDNLEFENKNMKENSLVLSHNDKNKKEETVESFLELLENSKLKVKETGESKQKYDLEQIEAMKHYQESHLNIQKLEKSLKKAILKSKPYYELKASINKELKFQLSKVEGLKSCLKEAKLFYHQSMKNLETISNEEHSKRQQRNNQQNHESACSSAANTQLITSSSISSTTSYNRNNTASSTNDDDIHTSNNSTNNTNKKKLSKRSTSTSSNNSITDISIDSNNANNKCITDEQIVNLSLDNKLYKYKQQIKLRPQFRASFVMKTNI